MDQEKRLKNLYYRIYKNYSLTMDDLLFLADHDRECYVKAYRHIVLDAPADRIFHKNIEIKEAPVTFDEDYRKRVAMVISKMRENRVSSDIITGVRPAAVVALIQEPQEDPSPQSRRYQYYSMTEPACLVNAQA